MTSERENIITKKKISYSTLIIIERADFRMSDNVFLNHHAC